MGMPFPKTINANRACIREYQNLNADKY